MSHVSSLSLVARRIVLPLFLMTGLLFTACGQSGGSSDVPAYDVGASITDSTTALIVESEYGTDTLTAQAFQQRVDFVQQRTPPQDRDEAGLHEQVVNQFMQIHLLTGVVEETDTLSAGSQSIPQAQVERQIEQIRQRFQEQRGQRQNLQDFETLEDFLATQGMTMDSLRASVESRMRQQMDQQRQRQKLQQAQQTLADDAEQPTDAEVTSYSEENPRVRAQHILLKAEENIPQAQDDSIRQRAQVLLDSARMDGVDFAELARRHSEGPSARQGGDLGYFSRDGQMVEPFAEAAFALQDSGDVYEEPVRTQFGYHIIRLSGEAQPMDTSQARSQMMQERRRAAYEDGMRDLRAQATLRVNPDVVKFDPQEGLAPDDEEGEQN